MTEQNKQWYEETPEQFANGFPEEITPTSARKATPTAFTASQLEQQITTMLRTLPIAITITEQDNRYIWQAYERSGEAESFSSAAEEALRYIFSLFLAGEEHTRSLPERRGSYQS
jgi:hypothetical protein